MNIPPESRDEKALWERDHPLEPLSRSRMLELLGEWLNGRRILDATLMSGGLMNRNFLLRLDAPPAACVLRIYDRDPSTCGREVAVLEKVGHKIPTPEVLYVDAQATHGLPLAVLSVVDGMSLFALRARGDDDALAEASYAIGRLLPAIGRFEGPATPTESLLALVERFVATARFRQRVSIEVTDGVLRLAALWQPRLNDMGTVSGLVHGDFNSRNIFVGRKDQGAWYVTGILDWEFALHASPFIDIGNFLRYHRPERPRYEPHFSRGLRDAGMDLPSDWLALARLMDLPALCELLSREKLPGSAASELVALLRDQLRSPAATLGV